MPSTNQLVKLLLPNNLNSTFLQAAIIDGGAAERVLDTGNSRLITSINPDPTLDANRATLSFGFALNDWTTRQPVQLGTVVSLKISNDPDFTPSATVAIVNWPANIVDLQNLPQTNTGTFFNPALNYTLTLDPSYFTNPLATTAELSRITAAGTGMFTILNWPLSANGGLATVYFQATVSDANGNTGTYPGDYGVYDQILWQAEFPSRPGTPVVDSPVQGYTGRRTHFAFRASEEPSAALYGTGVSRYEGDVLEIVPNLVYSTMVGANSVRTLAPYVAGGIGSVTTNVLTVTGKDWAVAGNTYSLNSNRKASDSNGDHPQAVTTTTGCYLVTAVSAAPTTTYPDLAAQAGVIVAFPDQNATARVRFALGGVDMSQSNDDELVVEIDVNQTSACVANFFHEAAGVASTKQTTTLPASFLTDILAGGVMELFCQVGTGSMPAQAYFTPFTGGYSYLLGSAIVPGFVSSRASCAALRAYALTETAAITVKELMVAGGRWALDADLGDGVLDDYQPHNFPTTTTSGAAAWTTAFTQGQWLFLQEWTSANQPTGIVNSNSPYNGYQLQAFYEDNTRAIAELFATSPTFSLRARVDVLGVQQTQVSGELGGEWYVAFTPAAVFNLSGNSDIITQMRPVATRCDETYGSVDQPTGKPTLLVGFDASRKVVHVAQRLVDGTLTDHILMPYAPATTGADNWYVEVSDTGPEGQQDGTWVWVRRNGDVAGTVQLASMMPLTNSRASANPLGWYVAVGVRTDRMASFNNTTNDLPMGGETGVTVNLTTINVVPLPARHKYGENYPPTIRHFVKENAGAVRAKPLLGQYLLAGGEEVEDFNLPSPDTVTSGTQAPVNIFLQRIPILQLRWIVSSLTPALVELRMRTRNNAVPPAMPMIRFHQETNGFCGVATTNWISPAPTNPTRGFGAMAPFNQLVQFDITAQVLQLSVSPGTAVWMEVQVPLDCEIANTSDVLPALLPIGYYSASSTQLGTVTTLFCDGDTTTYVSQSGAGTQTLYGTFDCLRPLTPTLVFGTIAGIGTLAVTLWGSNDFSTWTSIPITVTGVAFTTTAAVPEYRYYQACVAASGGNPSSVAELCEFRMQINGQYIDGGFETVNPFASSVANTRQVVVAGSTWLEANSIWYRIYARSAFRRDNIFDSQLIQTRVWADTYARLNGQPSALSAPAFTDLIGPAATGSTRPALAATLQPTVRSVSVSVSAQDAGSGLLAFSLGGEIDGGGVVYTPWLPWSAFKNASNQALYTLYLYGHPSVDRYGVNVASNLTEMNGGTDGPRRVWARAMDAVGNITESFPITVLATNMALVDTVPPTGTIQFVDSNGNPLAQTNLSTGVLNISTADRVSAVKDMRVRPLPESGSFGWSATPFNLPVTNFPVTFPVANGQIVNGLARYEAIFRDYGDNTPPIAPLWDTLCDSADKNVMFVAMATWSGNLYLSAIRSDSWANLSLVVSDDSDFAAGTAYTVVSFDQDSYQRTILLRSGDSVSVTIGSTVYTQYTAPSGATSPWQGAPANAFIIDAGSGLLVFNSALTTVAGAIVSVNRESAQLWCWDGTKVIRLVDMGYMGESAVLAMSAASDRIYLGGGSGNLWSFDGNTIVGPHFTATNNGAAIPISVLAQHQFDSEANGNGYVGPYLYVGTASVPRLYRALLSAATDSASWQQVGATGFLTSASGDLTCAASAYDTLFLGTNQGQVLRYQRRLTHTDGSADTETLLVSSLSPSLIGLGDGAVLPVACLQAAGNQMLAGIGDRPEVYSFSTQLLDNPLPTETWVSQVFGARWLRDSTPWQPYINGFTSTRITANQSTAQRVAAYYVSDPARPNGMRDLISLDGRLNETTAFTLSDGSDWEQVISNEVLNNPTPQYMVEFDMQNTGSAPTGPQGFLFTDGRYQLNVALDGATVTLTSGTNMAQASYFTPPVTAFSADPLQEGSLVYPERGVIYLWNFGQGSEDIGPYFFAGGGASTNGTEGWMAAQWVSGLATTSETESLSGSWQAVTGFLQVTPMQVRAPRIQVEVPSAISIDSQSRILIRARVPRTSGDDLRDARLRVAWSDSGLISDHNHYWTEIPVVQTGEFHTYIFSPAWAGSVTSLAIELAGLPDRLPTDNTARPTLDIDYVAITSDTWATDIRDNLTPVRVAVDGQRVRCWVGRLETPLIDLENFLIQPVDSDDLQLRFGKLSATDAASMWLWGGVRYAVGVTAAPVSRKEYDFAIQWRFPSAGGVRKFVMHAGTVWALTDGVYSHHRGDNPDHRAARAFAYEPTSRAWVEEAPPMGRSAGGLGVVRILAATSFGKTLVASGQQGNILF